MEKFEKIIKYFKSKKGKRTSFFLFYLVFFIFLFFYINSQDLPQDTSNDNENKLKPNNEIKENLNYYETNNLENSDYLYKITIQNNSELQILEGSKNNKDSINNYEYYELVDLNEIKRIIKNSKYLSKSLYSDNNYKVNYEIKNSNLYKLFNDEISNEIGDDLNNISLTVRENNDLIKIELDFSNYMKSINSDISLYKVLIEYEY